MMEEILLVIFALWIMAAGIWLPNILQVVWWRFNAWGYLSAWIANLGLSWLVVWIYRNSVCCPCWRITSNSVADDPGCLDLSAVTFLTQRRIWISGKNIM